MNRLILLLTLSLATSSVASPRSFDVKFMNLRWGDNWVKLISRFKVDPKIATFDGKHLFFPAEVSGLDVKMHAELTDDRDLESLRMIRRVGRGTLCNEFFAFREAMTAAHGKPDYSDKATTVAETISNSECESRAAGGQVMVIAWIGETYTCSLSSHVAEFGQRFISLGCEKEAPSVSRKRTVSIKSLTRALK